MERPQAEWLIEFWKSRKVKIGAAALHYTGRRAGNGRGTLLESFSDGVAVERGIAGCRYGKGNP